jgi:preprotein translocase subunit YajC
MFVFMYLLLIRPQRQQQRRHAEMVESLQVGDEIITVGGLYGDVTEVHPDRVTLEIAEDVEVEVAKRAVASVVPPEAGEELEATAAAEPVEDAEPSDGPDPAAAGQPAGETEAVPGARVAEEDATRR